MGGTKTILVLKKNRFCLEAQISRAKSSHTPRFAAENFALPEYIYQNINSSKVLQGAIHDADTILLFGNVSHHNENLNRKTQVLSTFWFLLGT